MQYRSPRWILLSTIAVLGACGKPAPPPAVTHTVDPWVLDVIDATAPTPALLTNGLLGLRLGRDGSGYGPNGKRLPTFTIDGYQAAGEEKLEAQAHPFLVRWTLDGETLLPDRSRPYSQSLDMRTGVLTTRWESHDVRFECRSIIDPFRKIASQSWWVVSPSRGLLEWHTVADGFPNRLRVRNLIDGTHSEEIAAGRYRAPRPGKPFLFERIATYEPGVIPSVAQMEAESQRVWKERWETDIEIDGPVEDQRAIRSFLYYLQSCVNPKAPRAVSPMDLSSERYFGHVFWDADVYVFPALALVAPNASATIPRYRLRMEAAARDNFQHWLASGRPVAGVKLGGKTPESPAWPGVMYPWESSVTGKETVPGDSRFEHHITGSVAWGLRLAAALGLADAKAVQRVRREAAAFYLNRIVRRPDGLFSLPKTMSPDENHIGDDDLYTNVLAQQLIDENTPSSRRRPTLIRPKDETSLLTYADDPVRGYKQAAAVLAIYPLQDPGAEKQSRAMIERFAPKTTVNGPAMSDSIHAVIWARLDEGARAYETWRKSWVPFTDHPLMLFSEKRRLETTYFTTGAAGALQSVLYGFLGIRIDFGQEPVADWSKSLEGRAWISVTPHLPPSWKSAKLKNFWVLGHRYTLTVDHRGVRVTEGDP
ncbi:MAG: hypothetical protein M9921_03625 [Fimbriimonadaceae bacterium]|nr:hypothetical protein [Fimbriimonadaceae bacterium]